MTWISRSSLDKAGRFSGGGGEKVGLVIKYGKLGGSRQRAIVGTCFGEPCRTLAATVPSRVGYLASLRGTWQV